MRLSMLFAISSYKGVGPIRFGMNPESVRQVLDSQYRSFKRTLESEMPLDKFTDLGVSGREPLNLIVSVLLAVLLISITWIVSAIYDSIRTFNFK